MRQRASILNRVAPGRRAAPALPRVARPGTTARHRAALARARTLILVLAAFAIAGLSQALLVKRFGVNLPFWDEWSANPRLLLSYRAGTLTWQSLFERHNEHRVLPEKLILLGTYALFGEWSPIANMLASALLVACIAAVWAYALRRLALPGWVGLLSALILVSPMQFENIVWGFQTSFYALALSTLIGICVVALARQVSWPVVLLAIAACFWATFSLLSGLLSWGIVGACLLLKAALAAPSLRIALRERGLWAKAALFCAAAVAHVLFYFLYHYNLVMVPGGQVQSVWKLLRWAAMALGYPLTNSVVHPAIVLAGAALLLWAPIALALALLVRRRRETLAQQRLVLFAGIALFVLGNAAVIGYGRASLGDTLASRYVTIFEWTGLLCLAAIAALLGAARTLSARLQRIALAGLLCLACAGLLLAQERRAAQGLVYIDEQHALRVRMQQTVSSYLSDRSPGRQLGDPAPYPAARKQELKQRLDNPAIVALLPADLRPAPDRSKSPTQAGRWALLLNKLLGRLEYLAAIVWTALLVSYLALPGKT